MKAGPNLDYRLHWNNETLSIINCMGRQGVYCPFREVGYIEVSICHIWFGDRYKDA